jgi:hypothetical protein
MVEHGTAAVYLWVFSPEFDAEDEQVPVDDDDGAKPAWNAGQDEGDR